MTRKYWIVGFLFFVVPSYTINFGPIKWFDKKQKRSYVVTVINDLTNLISAFPRETEELQKAIYSTIEVDGIPINADDKKLVSVSNSRFAISLKSKKLFHEHFNNVSSKIKKLLSLSTSWINVYYSFICIVPEGIDLVNLAPLVLYVCQEILAQKSYEISYKKPFGIQIWLRETIKLY